MSRWIPVPPPTAALENIDREDVREDDGRETHLFQTVNGVRFLRVCEPSGFVYWLQEVK